MVKTKSVPKRGKGIIRKPKKMSKGLGPKPKSIKMKPKKKKMVRVDTILLPSTAKRVLKVKSGLNRVSADTAELLEKQSQRYIDTLVYKTRGVMATR